MSDKVTIAALQQMKRDGQKIAGVVAWDTPMARIADLAGVDLVSVGDSVGVNLWGHDDPLEVTMDEMLIVCKAVRRGTTRALVSCDLPYGPVQESPEAAHRRRHAADGGGRRRHDQGRCRRRFPDAVRALVDAGIPVFAQFGLTPQTAQKFGIPYSAQNSPQAQASAEAADKLVAEAKMLEARRLLHARLHQFRPGRRRRGGEGRQNSGDRRLRRRPVARRPRAARAHRHRLRRQVARFQDRHLRQHRQRPRSARSRR